MPERIVRPGIITSDSINKLNWGEEVFYRRLMSIVDDHGRYDGRNAVLRAALYALKLNHVSDSDIDKWKANCANAGLIRIYFVDGREFVEVLKFDQRLRGKPKWPAAPDAGDSPQSAATRRNPPPSSGAYSDSLTETGAVPPDDLDGPREQAYRAFDRWSLCASPIGRGYGLKEAENEHRPISHLVESASQDPPIIEGTRQIKPHLLIPKAVDALRAKGKSFKSAKFAVGCAKSQLDDWRNEGMAAGKNGHGKLNLPPALTGTVKAKC